MNNTAMTITPWNAEYAAAYYEYVQANRDFMRASIAGDPDFRGLREYRDSAGRALDRIPTLASLGVLVMWGVRPMIQEWLDEGERCDLVSEWIIAIERHLADEFDVHLGSSIGWFADSQFVPAPDLMAKLQGHHWTRESLEYARKVLYRYCDVLMA